MNIQTGNTITLQTKAGLRDYTVTATSPYYTMLVSPEGLSTEVGTRALIDMWMVGKATLRDA